MKKMIRRLTAVILAVVLFAIPVMSSAEEKDLYISDIVAVSAGSYEEAKSLLQAEGYTIVEGNLNGTLRTGVYLGYKTTGEVKEAITDLALMNMKGNFNYSDYKTILEKQKDNIRASIRNFIPAVAEFQENYLNGKEASLLAYEALNVYMEEDSGKLMGDYLLTYDFSDGAETKLIDAFLQGNSQIILAIETAVAMAADNGDTTLIDRLQETGPEGVLDRYAAAYPTMAKAMQAMAAEYDGTATEIKTGWNEFYELLKETEEKYVKKNEDGTIEMKEDEIVDQTTDAGTEGISDAECVEYLEELNDFAGSAEAMAVLTDFTVYAALYSTEYADGTLLDFFMRPVENVQNTEIYPLVDALSDGQRAQIGIIGLRDTLLQAFGDLDGDEEEAKEVVDSTKEATDTLHELEVISIYTGIDRSIFGDGVAFTDKAATHEKLTGQSWIEKVMGTDNEKEAWMQSMYYTTITVGALAVATGISALVQYVIQRSATMAVRQAEIAYQTAKNLHDYMRSFVRYARGHMLPEEFFDEVNSFGCEANGKYMELMRAKRIAGEAGKVAKVVKCACFILMIVGVIFDVYSVIKYFTTDDPPEEAIPHHIVTTADTAYGTDYIYYATVKNLKGESADLNNHEANTTVGWLVLYQTKDTNAGEPIKAGTLTVQSGKDAIDPGYAFAHMFNETAAANVTSKNYTGVDDTAKNTYILFTNVTEADLNNGNGFGLGNAKDNEKEEVPDETKENETEAVVDQADEVYEENGPAVATVMVTNTNALVVAGGVGLLVGLAAGVIVMYTANKKKKEEIAA